MVIALLDALRTRLLPAFVTAMGVVLVTAGLFSYADPATAGTAVVEPPTIETLAPTEEPTATIEVPSPSAGPSASASADPSPTPAPTTFVGRAVATRVVIQVLKIDLPVVKGNAGYPYCDVAMYIKELGQPGEGRATYLYAHAREGMFLPILDASKVQNGKRMLGMVVEVWTSDDRRFLYEITEVRRHVPAPPVPGGLDDAIAASTEQLWLQASEGPGVPKDQPRNPLLQIVALPISEETADPADAHPEAKPLVCT